MDTNDIHDCELIREVSAGNRQAFRLFVEKYEKLVWHIVQRMVPNESDREDIAQEVFLKMFRNLDTFRHDCRMSSWVARISYNTALNHLKKKRVPLFNDLSNNNESGRNGIDEIASPNRTPEDDAESSDLASRLRAEVRKLGQPYSSILSLYHVEQMTYEEIAEITLLPIGTVKSYLYRARKLLKERLRTKYSREDL